MKTLTAHEALCREVIRVSAEQHPQLPSSHFELYAVFTPDTEELLGLVSVSHAMLYPLRIFADLVPKQQICVKPDTPLDDVRALLFQENTEAVAVVGQDGRFLGAITPLSLMTAMLQHEHYLLQQLHTLHQQDEADRSHMHHWSQQLLRLHDASRSLLQVLNLAPPDSELLHNALETLATLVHARYAALGVLDDDGRVSQFIYFGLSADEAARIDHLPEGKGLLGVVIHDNATLLVNDIAHDPRSCGFPPHHPPMHTLLAVPLARHGRVYGRLYVCDKHHELPFDADDEGIVTYFALALALVLDNAHEMQALKQAKDEVQFLQDYDQVTTLPSRQHFAAATQSVLELARRNGKLCALILIDLDRFKLVNETCGHEQGDEVLKILASRIRATLRREDLLTRLSGDEFIVLLTELTQADDAAAVIQKLQNAIGQPLSLGQLMHQLRASFGVTLFPTDGEDFDTLLQRADIALHKAKQAGRAGSQFFSPALQRHVSDRLRLENELRHAISANQLLLYYQPQVCLRTGSVIGLEALVRWQHPTEGLLLPGRFIPLAEESDLILALGEWVLQEACRQIAQWHADAVPCPTIAINLSARQFGAKGLIEHVEHVLKQAQLPGSCLECELTESLTMEHPEQSIIQMQKLKALGFKLSIDDFGTGYSNLAYLKRFPVDRLKLDMSFVRDIVSSASDHAICKAIIDMAHALELRVVAEGVETNAQLSALARLGCDEIQGYYYARPLPVEDCTSWLSQPPLWTPPAA